MSKDYKEITAEITSGMSKLRKSLPEVMEGFGKLSMGATKSGALSTKTKELIALAIGVSKQCDGCIGFHLKALIKEGATREEVEEALGMAVYMGGGPALMYAAEAIEGYDKLTQ
ncbi:MAG: carboxymuconolactone decarboxylase family protein [Chlamydiia bacterium]|nr:carboxymuconolactone decarboxylase family protein [Chlamydiia bacterium]